MGFPYGDTQAWLGVGCDGENEWAFFGFSNAPNLTDTEIEGGLNVIRTRVRWDDQVETTEFTQKWGASFIHFRKGRAAIAKIAASSTVLLELSWYGGRTYFSFSLNGSSAALAKARANCQR